MVRSYIIQNNHSIDNHLMHDLTGDFECFIIRFQTIFVIVLNYQVNPSHNLTLVTPEGDRGRGIYSLEIQVTHMV